MQVMIDIPEPLYTELRNSADEEKTTVSNILLRRVVSPNFPEQKSAGTERRVEFPLIKDGEPGPLMREDVNLNHVAWMDDDEIDELLAGR